MKLQLRAQYSCNVEYYVLKCCRKKSLTSTFGYMHDLPMFSILVHNNEAALIIHNNLVKSVIPECLYLFCRTSQTSTEKTTGTEEDFFSPCKSLCKRLIFIRGLIRDSAGQPPPPSGGRQT